ncbi:SPW repeat domain-containing protein [Amycolatopsis sp. NBC_01480]|uniref:SPW repeat domain-containing protein n=1 Tax=Amycolatopsis sp. NBC_01480 TaxID=2903562 RepID=UPI002E2D5816|nr:hypothetical protein [Amycolatopsis sp. NBC_01480]
MVDVATSRHFWIGPGTDERLTPSLPSSLVFLVALWLGFAPFVLHFGVAARTGFVEPDDVLVAMLISASALVRMTVPKDLPVLSVVNAAAGVWLVATAFLFAAPGDSVRATVNDVLCGVLLLGLGAASAALTYAQRSEVRARSAGRPDRDGDRRAS